MLGPVPSSTAEIPRTSLPLITPPIEDFNSWALVLERLVCDLDVDVTRC